MIDYEGKIVNEAFPSMPVEILGMNNSANAGAEFVVTDDEDEAKKLSEFKKNNTAQNKVLARIKQLYLRTLKKKTS